MKALATTAADGLALLPIRRRDEGDFIGYCGLKLGFEPDHVSADDGGELVWLTRSLP